MSKSFSDEQLSKWVTAVWLAKDDKRFLLDYFSNYETAMNYAKSLSHMKIDCCEILLGEITLGDLIKK